MQLPLKKDAISRVSSRGKDRDDPDALRVPFHVLRAVCFGSPWCVGLPRPTSGLMRITLLERVHFEGPWKEPRRRQIVEVSSPRTTDVILKGTSFEITSLRDEL